MGAAPHLPACEFHVRVALRLPLLFPRLAYQEIDGVVIQEARRTAFKFMKDSVNYSRKHDVGFCTVYNGTVGQVAKRRSRV